ncbi:DUF2971 domain-containing protein [Leptospira neocaledonica]|uniref:DUF2971 domain-containing protein n=1 Tax=Leptospira neocaledonica TaxID=2023192 RepID=A0A2M9ZXA6_9LEPT|nr:DUF2971 domain-containing protein [Leptospira neocaledonica]PJZ76583.1 hypothetical protein CH365_14535 [Leptospira neocaledonica]
MYKYYNPKSYNLEALSEGYFYLSAPEDFNDPFDSRTLIYYQGTIDEWTKLFMTKGLSKADASMRARSIGNRIIYPDPEKKREFERLNHAIVCFASSELNPLMWSHYADSHKGFCIKFRTFEGIQHEGLETRRINIIKDQLLFKEEYKDLFLIMKVKYSHQMPEEFNGFSDDLTGLNAFFITKSKEWEYEQEFRAIFKIDNIKNESRKIFYEKDSVESIYLGNKISLQDREKITRILKDHYIDKGFRPSVYQCELSKKSYSLEIRPT